MGLLNFFIPKKKRYEAALFNDLDMAKRALDKKRSNISSKELENKLKNSSNMSDLEISATVHYAKGDFNKAFSLYEQLSTLEPEGLYSLGTCYMQGKGTSVNHSKAFDLFTQAAALNHPKAMVSLALCYQTGDGTKIDQKKAMQLEDAAIELDEPLAYFLRAMRYHMGFGVRKNLKQTFNCLCKADTPLAFFSLGYMYKHGLGTEINHKEAFKFFKKSSDTGDPRGMFELAFYYHNGKSGHYDKAEAWYWAEKFYKLTESEPKINSQRVLSTIKKLKF